MSSSLHNDLKSMQLKPFQPIYSAKTIKSEPILKKRHQERVKTATTTAATTITTAETEISRTTSRSTPYNAFLSSSKNNFSASSAHASRAVSRLSETPSKIEKQTKKLDELNVSGSTNLSLLSLESNDSFPLFKTYGKFNYFSYFEKYMNKRSKFKIPRDLMPEQPTEEEISLMDKDDLFSRFELICLDRLYDIRKARPFRLRSKSVTSCKSIESHEKYLKPMDSYLTKLISVECVDPDYIDKKFEITKKFEKLHAKVELSDYEYRKNLLATFETEYDNIFPTFYARDIKYPRIYEWGERRKKKTINESDTNQNHMSANLNRYSNVESKLASYIRRKHSKITDNNYEKRSKTALSLHKFTSTQYNYYNTGKVNEKEKVKDNCLKMSSNLEKLIREEIRKNNGPIYFGEFNKENVEEFSNVDKIKLNDKFLNIYEWLSKINVEECNHFYDNPFTTETEMNTDISNYNPEPEYNFFRDENAKMDILQKRHGQMTKKFVIDPTQNIKLDDSNKNQLPRKKLRSNMGKEEIVETQDKKILAVNKDYETNFKLKIDANNTEKHNRNKERYITSRERLKKQLALNDILMTRMTLDIFCL